MLHIFHTIIILYIFNFVYLADLVYSNLLHSAHLFKICGMYVQILFLPCTGVLISPSPNQEGNKLQQPNSNFCKPLKKNSEGCPSNQVSAAAMTSASDEKWRPFSCFFSRVTLRTYQHPCIINPISIIKNLNFVSI